MKNNYRVLIFDDQKDIRELLWSLFDSRGYEVFTFPNPATCPLYNEHYCPCPDNQSCSDIIISDLDMPMKNGLAFIEEQIRKGCRCDNIALMSGNFTEEDVLKAQSIGVKIFPKPFEFTDILSWIDQVEKNIDPERELADFYRWPGKPERSSPPGR